MSWPPYPTAAVVVQKDERFLMVEEMKGGIAVLNQPAGHVEPGEGLLEAARREALEESGWEIEPVSLLGLYVWQAPNGKLFHRFCFVGEARRQVTGELDPDIMAAHWLDLETLRAPKTHLRSPLVLRCVEDYLGGKRFPLSFINEIY